MQKLGVAAQTRLNESKNRVRFIPMSTPTRNVSPVGQSITKSSFPLPCDVTLGLTKHVYKGEASDLARPTKRALP